jgi:hypothetical protein
MLADAFALPLAPPARAAPRWAPELAYDLASHPQAPMGSGTPPASGP